MIGFGALLLCAEIGHEAYAQTQASPRPQPSMQPEVTSRFELERKHGLIEAPKEQAGIAGDSYGMDALPPQRSYSSQTTNVPGTSNTSPYGTSNVYGTGGLPIRGD